MEQPKITKEDQKVLGLKVQRDKLQELRKKKRLDLEKDYKLLLEGRTEDAEVLREKIKHQEQILQMTDKLKNLDKTIKEVEFAQVQLQLADGLKQGDEALTEMKKTLDEVLSGRLTEEDQDALLKQIEERIKDFREKRKKRKLYQDKALKLQMDKGKQDQEKALKLQMDKGKQDQEKAEAEKLLGHIKEDSSTL